MTKLPFFDITKWLIKKCKTVYKYLKIVLHYVSFVYLLLLYYDISMKSDLFIWLQKCYGLLIAVKLNCNNLTLFIKRNMLVFSIQAYHQFSLYTDSFWFHIEPKNLSVKWNVTAASAHTHHQCRTTNSAQATLQEVMHFPLHHNDAGPSFQFLHHLLSLKDKKSTDENIYIPWHRKTLWKTFIQVA